MSNPVKNVAAIMQLKDTRLRNFILCTPANNEKTLGIFRRGAPELFTDQPESNYPVSMEALLLFTFGKIPARKKLVNAVDLFAACKQFEVPICLVLISGMWDDYNEEKDDGPYIPLAIDLQLYQSGCCIGLTDELGRLFNGKTIGDSVNIEGDEYVIVAIGHAAEYIALAPKAMIEPTSYV